MSGHPPVVLVHGIATSSARTWGDNGWLDLLADAGRTAVPLDQMGHGTAARPTDPAAYDLLEEELLERFANPATGHTTRQVAMDGTQKIPFRWGGTLADGLADRSAGDELPRGVVAALAAWASFVVAEVHAGRAVDDPRAEELRSIVEAADDGPAAVRALVRLPGLLPDDVDPGLLDGLVDAVVAASGAGAEVAS